MASRNAERGSALIMSVVVILVVTAIGLAVVRYSSREVAGAASYWKEAAVSNCADAGRALLMSQWRLVGTQAEAIAPLNVLLDPASQTRVQGGHYDQDPTAGTYWSAGSQTWVQNIQVMRLDSNTVGSQTTANDMTNSIGDGPQPYRVVVHCTQADGRQVEVEFAVQYGI